MKKVFSLLVMLSLNVGFAYAETYVSKENQDYTLEYVTPGAQASSVEECQAWSRQHPDYIVKCHSLFTTHFYLCGQIIDSKMDGIAKNTYLGRIQEKKQSETTEQTNTILALVSFVVIVVFLIIGIIGIIKGYKQEAVFFYSWKDLFATILYAVAICYGFYITITVAWLYITQKTEGISWWLLPLSFFVGVMGCYLNARVPYKYSDNKFTAFCVFTGRLLALFLALFVFAGWGTPSKRKYESDAVYAIRTATHYAIWTAVTIWFTRLARNLVNGKILAEDKKFEDAVKVRSRLA